MVVADAVSLPFPDAVADCVVAFMSLQDIEGFEQAVMEAGRVLTPQGYFVWQLRTHSTLQECLGRPQRSGTGRSLFVSPGSIAASSFGRLIAMDIQ